MVAETAAVLSEESERDQKLWPTQSDRATRFLAAGGYGFLAISMFAFFTTGVMVLWHRTALPPSGADEGRMWFAFFAAYFPNIMGVLTGHFTAIVGYMLLRSAGTAQREIIPRQDARLLYQLLLEENGTGLNNYVKLSGLSGFVGFCTKLGIGGLSLATITLTIFFALLGLASSGSGFFDLAKLTLGAFIGSYVQRQQSDFGSKGGRDSQVERDCLK